MLKLKHYKWSSLLILLVVLVNVSGCATTGQFVSMPDQSMTVQDPSKARIYVMRPAGYFGSGISMIVKDGDMVIGNTKGGGRYLSWERKPGIANITSKSENESRVSIEVEAGQRYYILQSVEMGIWVARTRLREVTEEDGRKYLMKCKPSPVVSNK